MLCIMQEVKFSVFFCNIIQKSKQGGYESNCTTYLQVTILLVVCSTSTLMASELA